MRTRAGRRPQASSSLSLPRELSALGVTKPDVLTALGRIFAEQIARITRHVAKVADSETGSLFFPQRFGGSLNLHLHFHHVAVDGVFEKQDGGVRFYETRPPEQEETEEVASPRPRPRRPLASPAQVL